MAARRGRKHQHIAVIAHLAGIIGFIGPLIVWLIFRSDSKEVDYHGKEALNFQLSILLYSAVAWALALVAVGLVIFPVIVIFNIIMIATAAYRASSGARYRYPITIRFVK